VILRRSEATRQRNSIGSDRVAAKMTGPCQRLQGRATPKMPLAIGTNTFFTLVAGVLLSCMARNPERGIDT
jgi:hypothetical protein